MKLIKDQLYFEKLKEILKQPYELANDSDIKNTLYLLLEGLLKQQEGFSGKRPFGESGWVCGFKLAIGLAFPDVVQVTKVDKYDYYDTDVLDREAFNTILIDLVRVIFNKELKS